MDKTALVIIDVQNGMFLEQDPVHNGDQLLHNLECLIGKAREKSVPVFYVQHNAPSGKPLEKGTTGWKIHSRIKPETNDVIIEKTTPDSFLGTDLDEKLKKHHILHLILAGIQTEACVDTTCRRAFSLGYDVTLASDGHSTWNGKEITAQQIVNHHNHVLQWFADTKPVSEIRF